MQIKGQSSEPAILKKAPPRPIYSEAAGSPTQKAKVRKASRNKGAGKVRVNWKTTLKMSTGDILNFIFILSEPEHCLAYAILEHV